MWLRRLLLAVFTILSEEDYFFHHTKQNVKHTMQYQFLQLRFFRANLQYDTDTELIQNSYIYVLYH